MSSTRTRRAWPSDVLCAELVRLRTNSRELAAVLEAIGEMEAILWCEESLRWGRIVEVEASCWSPRARVTGSRRDKASQGYVILVSFLEPFRWTAEAFCPEHMLDLRKPAAIARVLSAGRSV